MNHFNKAITFFLILTTNLNSGRMALTRTSALRGRTESITALGDDAGCRANDNDASDRSNLRSRIPGWGGGSPRAINRRRKTRRLVKASSRPENSSSVSSKTGALRVRLPVAIASSPPRASRVFKWKPGRRSEFNVNIAIIRV